MSERRGATESELRNAQLLAVEAARNGAAQGWHRATVANATGDAARSIIPSAGEWLPGVPVIIGASVDAVANAASRAAHEAMTASGGKPDIVADEVRRATDEAINYSIRGA